MYDPANQPAPKTFNETVFWFFLKFLGCLIVLAAAVACIGIAWALGMRYGWVLVVLFGLYYMCKWAERKAPEPPEGS
jgi:hypothetical protein